MINFRKNILGDSIIIFIISLLFIIGLIMLYSATYNEKNIYSFLFVKQMVGMSIGIAIIVITSCCSYKTIIAWGALLHYFTVFLLCVTKCIGYTAMGAQRWINLGFIKFQPSELAKVTLPLWIIHYFLMQVTESPQLKDWFIVLGVSIFTALIIIKQPDLGSGLIVGISAAVILYIMGLPRSIIITFLTTSFLLIPIFWHCLHDYQKKRILVFLGDGSSHKERYQLEQSKIAVGSGGFWGKGYTEGTQKKFNFLPEYKTDFIFAVLGEEFGFLGIVFIIILYFLLLVRFAIQCFKIDDFHAFALSYGLMSSVFISILCNIGMVIGLLPVVGIPLPCISYGLTHIWGTCFTIGIINSILSTAD